MSKLVIKVLAYLLSKKAETDRNEITVLEQKDFKMFNDAQKIQHQLQTSRMLVSFAES